MVRVQGEDSGNRSKWNHYVHPWKTNMDTQNDEALEKVPPALKMAIFGIYVKISGRYIVLR